MKSPLGSPRGGWQGTCLETLEIQDMAGWNQHPSINREKNTALGCTILSRLISTFINRKKNHETTMPYDVFLSPRGTFFVANGDRPNGRPEATAFPRFAPSRCPAWWWPQRFTSHPGSIPDSLYGCCIGRYTPGIYQGFFLGICHLESLKMGWCWWYVDYDTLIKNRTGNTADCFKQLLLMLSEWSLYGFVSRVFGHGSKISKHWKPWEYSPPARMV